MIRSDKCLPLVRFRKKGIRTRDWIQPNCHSSRNNTKQVVNLHYYITRIIRLGPIFPILFPLIHYRSSSEAFDTFACLTLYPRTGWKINKLAFPFAALIIEALSQVELSNMGGRVDALTKGEDALSGSRNFIRTGLSLKGASRGYNRRPVTRQ
jgi:hypothetical protein